jgi:hypothetical protein
MTGAGRRLAIFGGAPYLCRSTHFLSMDGMLLATEVSCSPTATLLFGRALPF